MTVGFASMARSSILVTAGLCLSHGWHGGRGQAPAEVGLSMRLPALQTNGC